MKIDYVKIETDNFERNKKLRMLEAAMEDAPNLIRHLKVLIEYQEAVSNFRQGMDVIGRAEIPSAMGKVLDQLAYRRDDFTKLLEAIEGLNVQA